MPSLLPKGERREREAQCRRAECPPVHNWGTARPE